MNDGVKVRGIWAAAALGYAGYEVSRIEILDDRTTEISFEAPSEDARIIIDDYENNRLVLSDAKAYSLSFTKISRQASTLRASGEKIWTAPPVRDAEFYARGREQLKVKQAARK
jgi:hypothetical protein